MRQCCAITCRVLWACIMVYTLYGPSLVPRPSHVFNVTRRKEGRPGRFCDVIITYLPPFLPCYAAARPRFELPSNPRLPAYIRIMFGAGPGDRGGGSARALTGCGLRSTFLCLQENQVQVLIQRQYTGSRGSILLSYSACRFGSSTCRFV